MRPAARHWRDPWARTAAASFALTAASMIAIPLLPPGKRRVASSIVVSALATTTGALLARRHGPARAGAAAVATALVTTAAEHVGTATGLPFGRYRYSGALQPSVGSGRVPVIVPLAWFAMAAPAREVATRRWWGGALALTAWDLFLDPQMVAEGYWTWARRGRYRGIPVSNYLGWVLVGSVVMRVLDVVLADRRSEPSPDRPDPDRALVGVYAWMAVMQTLGFALFFGDPLVSAVGGTAMGVALAAGHVASRR
jgi:uncharacterized membrane protein